MIIVEIEELKRLVEERYGKTINTSTDFDELSLYLSRAIGESISTSTLKRLWNYVNDTHKPRVSTLDVLSRFLGHSDYASFIVWLKTSVKYNSSFFNVKQLQSSSLSVGCKVEIGWSPNRYLLLKYLGDNIFEVESAENSKLLAGDRFATVCFMHGYPLFLSCVERDAESIGSFVAGRNGGLTMVKILSEK